MTPGPKVQAAVRSHPAFLSLFQLMSQWQVKGWSLNPSAPTHHHHQHHTHTRHTHSQRKRNYRHNSPLLFSALAFRSFQGLSSIFCAPFFSLRLFCHFKEVQLSWFPLCLMLPDTRRQLRWSYNTMRIRLKRSKLQKYTKALQWEFTKKKEEWRWWPLNVHPL